MHQGRSREGDVAEAGEQDAQVASGDQVGVMGGGVLAGEGVEDLVDGERNFGGPE